VKQKEGELAAVQKQLKNLENKHREIERKQADVAQQNVITASGFLSSCAVHLDFISIVLQYCFKT
jgi:hypothetical protein